MIITIRFIIIQNKYREICQTLKALQDLWKKKRGYLGSYIYRDIQKENIFCLMQEWTNREDMDAYLNSDDFGVLLGAIRLLAASSSFRISSVISTKPNNLLTREVVKK